MVEVGAGDGIAGRLELIEQDGDCTISVSVYRKAIAVSMDPSHDVCQILGRYRLHAAVTRSLEGLVEQACTPADRPVDEHLDPTDAQTITPKIGPKSDASDEIVVLVSDKHVYAETKEPAPLPFLKQEQFLRSDERIPHLGKPRRVEHLDSAGEPLELVLNRALGHHRAAPL